MCPPHADVGSGHTLLEVASSVVSVWVAGPGQVAPDVRGAGGGGGPQGADQGAGGAHARRGVREQGPAQRRHPGDPGQVAAAAASAAEPAPAAVHDRTHPFHLLITTRAPCRLVLDSFRSGPVRCARPPACLPACLPACQFAHHLALTTTLTRPSEC